MGYVRWVIIVLLANQASIAGAIAGERMILREPDAVIGQKHAGGHATKDARAGPVTLLDRSIASPQRLTARSRAMAKISRCGAPTPPGLKGRCKSGRRQLRMSVVGIDLT